MIKPWEVTKYARSWAEKEFMENLYYAGLAMRASLRAHCLSIVQCRADEIGQTRARELSAIIKRLVDEERPERVRMMQALTGAPDEISEGVGVDQAAGDEEWGDPFAEPLPPMPIPLSGKEDANLLECFDAFYRIDVILYDARHRALTADERVAVDALV